MITSHRQVGPYFTTDFPFPFNHSLREQSHMPHWLEVLSLPALLRDHVETLVSVCGGGAQAIRPQYLSHHQSLAAQGKGNGSQAHIPVTYQILPTPITSCGLHHNQHIVQNKQPFIKSSKKLFIYSIKSNCNKSGIRKHYLLGLMSCTQQSKTDMI